MASQPMISKTVPTAACSLHRSFFLKLFRHWHDTAIKAVYLGLFTV